MTIRGWAWVAVLLSAPACAQQEPTEAPPNFLRDAEVVDAGTATAATILPWRIDDTPRIRIGGAAEDVAHQFVEISAATVLSDGSVLVADGEWGVVRRYGPRGEFLQQLGAVGEGPGEFRSPTAVSSLPGDSMVVWDREFWRTAVFDAEGRFVRSARFDPTADGVYPVNGMWPVAVNLARGGTRMVHLISKGSGKGSVAPGASRRAGLALHSEESRFPQLLAELPGPEEVEVNAPWGTALVPPPLAGGPAIAFDARDDRVCFGHQRAREILCVHADGMRKGVQWIDAPRPVDPFDPAILNWRSTTMRAYGGKLGVEVAEEVVAQVPVPDSHPAFGELLFDSLGYLWIEVGPADGSLVEREYFVLDTDLRVAGRLKLPTMELAEVGADYVLGVRHDAAGVAEAVLFELIR